jgi:acyl dehydratase
VEEAIMVLQTTYNKGIRFEDYNVGDEFVSASRTITESDIWMFASLTGDFTPLHTDEEFAKKGPFGTRIAHGLLTVVIGTGLANQTLMFEGTSMALLDSSARYLGVVKPGDTIRTIVKVADKKETQKYQDRGIVTFDWFVYNQKDECVVQARWVLMIRKKEF